MIIYALKNVKHISTSAVLLQPWFIVLVVAGAIERLCGLALGVTVERDWIVLVIYTVRLVNFDHFITFELPIALIQCFVLLCEVSRSR